MREKDTKAQNIPNLDQIVLQTLDFFISNPPPHLNVDEFKSPLVVGSGNADNTGRIIFSGRDVIFADESNFKSVMISSNKKTQDGQPRDVVVISASGGKDSKWEVELAKANGLRTTLLTTKPESEAAKIADRAIAFKAIAEPYTYNTSTYMGMMLGAVPEDISRIKKYIESLKFPENFGNHKGYAFVVPDQFMQICPMLEIKQSELFGFKVAIRAFPQGHARHAKFVIRDPEEMVMSLGQKNKFFGDPNHRWDIELPKNMCFAGIMALTYYIVGKIQASKQPYYKENIARYTSEDGPAAYGPDAKPFTIIVPGSEG
jgi:hypothetical protein